MSLKLRLPFPATCQEAHAKVVQVLPPANLRTEPASSQNKQPLPTGAPAPPVKMSLLLLLGAFLFSSCGSVNLIGGRVQPMEAPRAAESTLRVNTVLSRLLPEFPPKTCRRYIVLDSPVPNASINGRGTLRLTTGLLEFSHTDDLLAFALAHELAHSARGHPERDFRNGCLQALVTGAAIWATHEWKGSNAGAALAGTGMFVSTTLLGTLPDRRRMEREADRIAKQILWRAGYRPQAAAEFWFRYARSRPERPLPRWLSSHPSDLERALLLTR